jgi:hypothetical protein
VTDQPARSPRRRFALDPRLLVGMALVGASVVSVVALVGAADARVTVYAADSALSPGDRVTAADLLERSVALDGTEGLYLTEADLPEDGLIVTKAVAAGELVPLSAAGSVDGLRATALVLELSMRVSSAVGPGTLVDIWSSAAEEQGSFGPPTVLAPDVVVVRILEDDGIVADSSEGTSVEVLVPRSRVARLLQAVANRDALAIVPAGLPLEPR